MARGKVAAELRLLNILEVGKPITPTEIDDYLKVGNKSYASKYVLYLKIRGFGFDIQKDGRSVVSYTLVSEPTNVKELREQAKGNVVSAAKPKAAKKQKVVKVKAKAPIVGTQYPSPFENTESSYSVASDFDDFSVEDLVR